jgi:exopolyphosphatase/guanosine-5'-triphosphate,3'-diphosphate pyrophosphatase
LVWDEAERRLELHLTRDGQDLYGEVAQARLTSLAQAMRADMHVVPPQ